MMIVNILQEISVPQLNLALPAPALEAEVSGMEEMEAGSDTFQISVASVFGQHSGAGRTITLNDISDSTHVSTIKQLIEKKTRTPSNLYRLVFSGKILEDSKTMAYYGIAKDCTIHQV